jgi:hypothetical protein
MNESVYEILEKISKLKTVKQRVSSLSKYQNDFAVKVIVDCVYNPNIEFLLPETDPPYTPVDKAIDAQNVLKRDVRRLKYFLNLPEGEQLRPFKREQLFIEMLEAVDPNDAKLLLSVKNKKLPFEGITAKIVADAFPGIDEKWKK